MSFSFFFPPFFSLGPDDDESASSDHEEVCDEWASDDDGILSEDKFSKVLDNHLKGVSVAELGSDVDCSICLNSIHVTAPGVWKSKLLALSVCLGFRLLKGYVVLVLKSTGSTSTGEGLLSPRTPTVRTIGRAC
ncbi:unnamed protein product [Linum trigynum]|uniref:EF-hand domain-containing protein n=1 Tax=Linum trigynum TaxID=586398 RepID=A0AAV2FT00_9ROSI